MAKFKLLEMLTYSIFLASSNELLFEREKFEIFIARRNEIYKTRNVRLELKIWETVSEELGAGRKQNEYNSILKTADVVIVLFWTKVGMYTEEEYRNAIVLREKKDRPKVYVYEKTEKPAHPISIEDETTKLRFIEALKADGKFHARFKDSIELERKFLEELDQLFNEGYFKSGESESLLGSVFKFAKRILGISFVLASIVMFYFRRDVISRWTSGDPNSPIHELIAPLFLLIIGILIFIFRFKKK
ncbi:hypothetical protein [Algoriphagus terrigena]|uniref:hypothetical protein n=1 Tax=Algoriphagus terrigena TaxID=344884 RepID=UPI0012FCF0D8|nr:hypothetical protein [Algoriphagus terrigena]